MSSQVISTCRFCFKLMARRRQLNVCRNAVHQQQLPSSARLAPQYSTDSKHVNGKSTVEEEEVDPDVPYSFSKSKAAHWSVDRSFGAQYERPWWKVAPVSLGLFALVAWIFLRSETDLDRQLEVTLSERIPDLFSSSEEESSEAESLEAESIVDKELDAR